MPTPVPTPSAHFKSQSPPTFIKIHSSSTILTSLRAFHQEKPHHSNWLTDDHAAAAGDAAAVSVQQHAGAPHSSSSSSRRIKNSSTTRTVYHRQSCRAGRVNARVVSPRAGAAARGADFCTQLPGRLSRKHPAGTRMAQVSVFVCVCQCWRGEVIRHHWVRQRAGREQQQQQPKGNGGTRWCAPSCSCAGGRRSLPQTPPPSLHRPLGVPPATGCWRRRAASCSATLRWCRHPTPRTQRGGTAPTASGHTPPAGCATNTQST